MGQPVVIDNRAGAGGVIATEQVARAPADGYTMLMGTIGGLAVAMSLQPNRGYDTLRDFAPVTQAVTVTNILAVHPTLPVRNVKELLALAKARPGQLTYASSGSGTVTHLAGELLKTMAQVDIIHVPSRAARGADRAHEREVAMSYENSLVLLPHVKSGKVRALGVTGAKRSRLLPDLPTVAEAALPGYDASGWYGSSCRRPPRRTWSPASMPRPCASCACPRSLTGCPARAPSRWQQRRRVRRLHARRNRQVGQAREVRPHETGVVMSIEVTKADGVATVLLNRPDKLNALSGEMYHDLAHHFEALGDDDEVRAVILTGAGRAFCAGGDIGTMGSSTSSPAAGAPRAISG